MTYYTHGGRKPREVSPSVVAMNRADRAMERGKVIRAELRQLLVKDRNDETRAAIKRLNAELRAL